MDMSSMANSWVDSYLEALLSAGLSTEYSKKAREETANAEAVEDPNIAAKYYINQILTMGEDSIKEAWQKVSHKGRLAGERDARLEHLSWRVWGMKRKQAMLRDANAQALAELGKAEPVSEDQASAVDEEELAKLYTPKLRVNTATRSDSSEEALLSPEVPTSPALSPAIESALSEARVPKLYCVLISMHGLVRGQCMELGKDPDTGGQVKYVVEYAKALARHPAVHRVDLLTRLIRDPKVASEYGQVEEALDEPEGQLGGAYIVRVPCGPTDTYLKKEQLWPFIREFADNAIEHVVGTLGRLMAAGEPCELYDVHGHYADAGEAAALMSFTLGADMVLTGHSLGRNKLEHLLKSGTMSRTEIEATYAITRRIEAEERALDAAAMVFTSTQQEVRDQWGLYDGYDLALAPVVRLRYRKGRHFPLMSVIPPGLDFSALKVEQPTDPFDALVAGDGHLRELAASLNAVYGGKGGSARGSTASGPQVEDASLDALSGAASPHGTVASPRAAPSPREALVAQYRRPDPPIWQEIFRFLRNPRKPVILAMSRPDAKKNITTLVRAYGGSKALREIANLVLVMGNREVIDSMAAGSQKVLEGVLKLIDTHDLYGSVAYPKHHTQADISDIYLLPAATRGVFVNIALQEPFGLTLIEAAAHGVPIVATTNGGPVDIIHTLRNGELVEPTDERAVADALLKILMHPQVWDEYSHNGIANINAYSWPSHCRKALASIEGEKQGAVKRKRNIIRATFSAALDDFQLLGAVPATPATPASPGGGGGVDSPSARSASDALLDAAALREELVVAGTPLSMTHTRAYGASASARPLASSSVPLDQVYGGGASEASGLASPRSDAGAETERAKTPFLAHVGAAPGSRLARVRDKYVVFTVDTRESLVRLGALLARRGKALLAIAGAGQRVGLGVASAFSLSETSAMLAAAGLGLADLDFVVTNAGAEIWYCAEGDAQLDEGYELLVDDKWDKASVRRVLAQILAQRSVLLGAAAFKGAVSTAKSLRPRLSVQTDAAPHHILFELRAPRDGDGGGAAAEALAALLASPEEQLAMVERIRRRFRRSGLRTQMMAHLDGSGAAKVHITPLRASRALALRYMAHKHKVPLSSLVVVAVASSLEGDASGPGATARSPPATRRTWSAGCRGCWWCRRRRPLRRRRRRRRRMGSRSRLGCTCTMGGCSCCSRSAAPPPRSDTGGGAAAAPGVGSCSSAAAGAVVRRARAGGGGVLRAWRTRGDDGWRRCRGTRNRGAAAA